MQAHYRDRLLSTDTMAQQSNDTRCQNDAHIEILMIQIQLHYKEDSKLLLF